MYADYFGFRELPFNNTPDPRFFYSTPDHEEALASLIYAVKERKGFLLLTGEIGAGKTLVTRMMLRHFGSHIAFATIHHAVQTPQDLMESICTEFNLPVQQGMSSTQMVRMLHDYLLEQFSENLPVALLLDEAQNLSSEGFEQLRMIGNLEADDAKLLQIAIVGQPELQRRFLSPDLRQLRQRIFRTFHIPALNKEATKEYIKHRLAVVTDDPAEIFDDGAIEAIWACSSGVPRVVNTTCDNALLSAYSADRKTIDRAFIETVCAQMLTIGGTHRSPLAEEHRPPRPAPFPDAVSRCHDPQPSKADAAQTGDEHPRDTRTNPPEPAPPTPACTQTTPALVYVDAPVPPAIAPQTDPIARQRDLVGTASALTGRIEASERRLEALEGTLRLVHEHKYEAQKDHDALVPRVQEARSVTAKTEKTAEALQKRDAQVRNLTTTIKSVVRDLNCLLDRAQNVSVDQNNAESRAVLTHQRLKEQSRWSSKVAEELGDLVAQMVGRKPSPVSTRMEVAHGPGERSNKPGYVSPVKSLPVELTLHDTRNDREEPRHLAGPRKTAAIGTDPRSPIAAAKHLAARVETLLQVIDPSQDSSST